VYYLLVCVLSVWTLSGQALVSVYAQHWLQVCFDIVSNHVGNLWSTVVAQLGGALIILFTLSRTLTKLRKYKWFGSTH
jgi:hypothetical protein